MYKEIDFENDIEISLTSLGGYVKGKPEDYDADNALFPKDVIGFVQQDQHAA